MPMFPTRKFERLVIDALPINFFAYFCYPQQLKIGLEVPKLEKKNSGGEEGYR